MKPICTLLAGATLAAASAFGQDYPAKPIRVIVPYAPGGGLDIVGRPIIQRLGELYGQPVLLDNRPGAGTVIGTNVAAKSPADGYTLLLTLSALTIGPALNPKLPYDPVKDFAPVIWVGTTSYILSIHPSVPANSVKQLIALSKAKPGVFNYSSPGQGTDPHMAAELFKLMARVDWTHIPYNGGGPAATALMGGQVDLHFLPTSVGMPFVTAGKVKALAVSTAKRSNLLPDLPTIAESGVPGYSAEAWSGILAPAGTPKEIVVKLNAAIAKIVQSADYRALLEGRMVEPVGSSVEQFSARLQDDVAKWHKVVKQGGIKTE